MEMKMVTVSIFLWVAAAIWLLVVIGGHAITHYNSATPVAMSKHGPPAPAGDLVD